MMKFKDIDKIKDALMNKNINIWNIRTRITPDRTRNNYQISIWHKFKLVFYAKYDRGFDLLSVLLLDDIKLKSQIINL
jgi:hypothetical protein